MTRHDERLRGMNPGPFLVCWPAGRGEGCRRVVCRPRCQVDAFHLVQLGNNMLTDARQRLTQETRGRRTHHGPGLGQPPAAPPRRRGALRPGLRPAQERL